MSLIAVNRSKSWADITEEDSLDEEVYNLLNKTKEKQRINSETENIIDRTPFDMKAKLTEVEVQANNHFSPKSIINTDSSPLDNKNNSSNAAAKKIDFKNNISLSWADLVKTNKNENNNNNPPALQKTKEILPDPQLDFSREGLNLLFKNCLNSGQEENMNTNINVDNMDNGDNGDNNNQMNLEPKTKKTSKRNYSPDNQIKSKNNQNVQVSLIDNNNSNNNNNIISTPNHHTNDFIKKQKLNTPHKSKNKNNHNQTHNSNNNHQQKEINTEKVKGKDKKENNEMNSINQNNNSNNSNPLLVKSGLSYANVLSNQKSKSLTNTNTPALALALASESSASALSVTQGNFSLSSQSHIHSNNQIIQEQYSKLDDSDSQGHKDKDEDLIKLESDQEEEEEENQINKDNGISVNLIHQFNQIEQEKEEEDLNQTKASANNNTEECSSLTNENGEAEVAENEKEKIKSAPPRVLTEEERAAQRQKQINLGKRTAGYQTYLAVVPKMNRGPDRSIHPRTPNKNKICSKRQWDGIVRAWRRALHKWDGEIVNGLPVDKSFSSGDQQDSSQHSSVDTASAPSNNENTLPQSPSLDIKTSAS